MSSQNNHALLSMDSLKNVCYWQRPIDLDDHKYSVTVKHKLQEKISMCDIVKIVNDLFVPYSIYVT